MLFVFCSMSLFSSVRQFTMSTIAKYVANRGIPVLDIGVPVLSMHAPFEVIHKNDLYMAYRAFSLFNNAQ